MAEYHHGNLRRAVLDRALEIVATDGAAALNIRSVAADLGVSHTAPRHHFGTRTGLLTAIAIEGFGGLADRLANARRGDGLGGGTFLDIGVAYVDFALDHPAHFTVMFQPTLLDGSDDTLRNAEARAFAELTGGVDSLGEHGDSESAATAAVAGWSLMHGLATLALTGNLDRSGLRALIAEGDLHTIAAGAGALLFARPSSERRPTLREVAENE